MHIIKHIKNQIDGIDIVVAGQGINRERIFLSIIKYKSSLQQVDH